MADANCSVTQIDSDAGGNVYVAGAKGGELYMDSHEVTYPTTSAIFIKFTSATVTSGPRPSARWPPAASRT